MPYSAIQFACYGNCRLKKKRTNNDCVINVLLINLIEQFKKIAQNNFTKPGEHLPIGIDMLTGSLAGGIAGAVTTPLDVMKTLLQTQQSSSSSSSSVVNATKKKPLPTPIVTTVTSTKLVEPPVKHYSGILDGMIWNYKNQGLAGLFRGIGPRVFWTSLQSAIMFVVYEQVLHMQSNLRDNDEWPPTKIAEKFV